MAGTIERNNSNLHDADTGELVGYKNPVTGKEAPLNARALNALVSGTVGLSGVTYDGSNRATAWTIGANSYTVAYGAGTITVTGSDASVVTIALDGSSRITGVTVA